MSTSLIILALGTIFSATASAQTPGLYDWEAPDAYTQLDRDASELPAGTGAVFVPSLSVGSAEPHFYVVSSEQVYEGTVGRRIALDPGRYVVLVGSSDPRLSAKTSVEVVEGQTTLVPVNYGGLRLNVVDRRSRPVKSARLELIQEDTGEAIKNWPDLGEEATVRLLKPGAYRLQQPGSDAGSSPDFTTVWIPEGGLVNLRVFVDARGELLGAGAVPSDVVETPDGPKKDPWRKSLLVGADGSLIQNQGVIGRPDFTIAQGSLFAEGHLAYVGKHHLLEVDGSLNEGAMLFQPSTGKPLPLIKSADKLQADARYTFLLNEGVGFYAGVGAETALFPMNAVAAQDTTVVFRKQDGTTERLEVAGGDTYRLSESLNPLLARGGAGVRFRFSTLRDFDLSLHGGVGFRSYKLANSYMPVGAAGSQDVEYLQLYDINRAGLEAGVSGTVRITNFLTYTTDLSLFAAPQNFGHYIASWDNDLSVAITRMISIHYRAHLDQIREFTEKPQITQGVFLRASWNVL